MEAHLLLLLIAITLYLLLDALSANRAFVSRVRQPVAPVNPAARRPGILYVFVRWPPSPEIKMDVPVVYYIPCDNQETALKLSNLIHPFVSGKGDIVDLPDASSLQEYVSDYYQLKGFVLSRFPIPANKILEGMAG